MHEVAGGQLTTCHSCVRTTPAVNAADDRRYRYHGGTLLVRDSIR